jgi:hypothetical protein
MKIIARNSVVQSIFVARVAMKNMNTQSRFPFPKDLNLDAIHVRNRYITLVLIVKKPFFTKAKFPFPTAINLGVLIVNISY